MIASVSGGNFASTEASSARENRFDDSSQAQSFAGVLSGVMHHHAHKPEAAKPKDEGTSELDKSDKKDDDGDTAPADAAATSSSNTATSTSAVVRSVAALDPALQGKLARVMERVRDETGHDVQVAETYRSQARQDALYAQGRDTAGPVVTWTHNSKHTQGRAVDLVLDGGAAGPDAYQALQRIANEEGLRTLGAKDPGHLELPGRGTTANDATSMIPTEPADATGSGTGTGQVSISRLAQVARVATVQAPQPAAVAKVAAPGGAAAASAVTQAAIHAATKGSRGDTSSQSGGDSRGYSALSAAVAMRSASSRFPTEAVAAAAPSDAAARAEKVQAALDSAPARSLSQITMAVDAGNGTTDRIQLSMRGSSLSTTIDAADPRAAQAMTTHSDDLVRSLNRDGVQVDSLRIRAATDTTSGITAATGGQASQSSNDASRHSRFDRGNAWNQQQDHQERQRSQQDRRQQQRQRRGGLQ